MVNNLTTEPVLDAADHELRLLGRIAAGVAHDLNNYLCATDALLALMETDPTDLVQVRRARMSIDQAKRLTASLVSYVRGEPPVFAPVDLGALVRHMLGLVARLFPPGITLRIDIASGLPLARGSAAELEQLVLNLVLNAADAMLDGGDLGVRVQPTGGRLLYLEVSDTGTGMPASAHVTGDGRTPSTRPGRRAGLGLGIVRRVIERHDGSLEFASRSGVGTVVGVLLPVA
jgi:two-component system cell cycle sensor histidine kinase/response regulator CckA